MATRPSLRHLTMVETKTGSPGKHSLRSAEFPTRIHSVQWARMGSFVPDIYIFFDIADLLRAKKKIVRHEFMSLSQNVIITYHPLLCTNMYRIAMLLSLHTGVASLGRVPWLESAARV